MMFHTVPQVHDFMIQHGATSAWVYLPVPQVHCVFSQLLCHKCMVFISPVHKCMVFISVTTVHKCGVYFTSVPQCMNFISHCATSAWCLVPTGPQVHGIYFHTVPQVQGVYFTLCHKCMVFILTLCHKCMEFIFTLCHSAWCLFYTCHKCMEFISHVPQVHGVY